MITPAASYVLPKIELHCHLDGVIDAEMVLAIQQQHPEFPLDAQALHRASPTQGMESFFGWFAHSKALDRQQACWRWIAGEQVERLKAQNVRYAEWMLPAGSFGLREGVELALERTASLCRYVDERQGDETQIVFNVGIGRNRPPEVMEALLPALLALYEAGLIAGVALAGPEIGYPVRPFKPSLARLHEAGLGIEIHAGEWAGPESVWDALENGCPDRIGHGVSLFRDPRLVEIFQERQIHVEMCPTSNWRTGSVRQLEEHPIALARQLGLNFSVNTDDPGAFACSMVGEYALLADRFGFQAENFERLYQNSWAARFPPIHQRVAAQGVV